MKFNIQKSTIIILSVVLAVIILVVASFFVFTGRTEKTAEFQIDSDKILSFQESEKHVQYKPVMLNETFNLT